jgi:hypothetical protein
MDRGCCKVKRGAGRKEVKRTRGWEWLIERFEGRKARVQCDGHRCRCARGHNIEVDDGEFRGRKMRG